MDEVDRLRNLLKSSEALNDTDVHFMLEHIGDPNPVVRDDIICSLFYTVFDEHRISISQARMIFNYIYDNHLLFLNIEKHQNQDVFTRTFSVLVLALLLDSDCRLENGISILNSDQRQSIFHDAMRYLNEEKDHRGYISGYGWAHGIAHDSDLLVEVVKHPNFKNSDVDKILGSIDNLIFSLEYPFTANEESRLSNIIAIGLVDSKRLNESQINLWIRNLLIQISSMDHQMYAYSVRFETFTRFLESLYFKLNFKESAPSVQKSIKEILSDQFKKLIL